MNTSPKLVRDHISHELAEAFDQLAELVRDGTVVGAVFGVALRGKKYHVNVAGTLARDPTFARGVVAALDDELMAMVQGRADADTTI